MIVQDKQDPSARVATTLHYNERTPLHAELIVMLTAHSS